MAKRQNCIFNSHCGNKIEHPKSETCHACYNSLAYWLKGKSPTMILSRLKKLALYRARMESISNLRVLDTVTEIHLESAPKRKKRAA